MGMFVIESVKAAGTAIRVNMMVAWQGTAGSAAAKHNTAATCSRLSHLQSSCHFVEQKQTTKDTREKDKYIKGA